jgi:predicted DNA-binding transcriptional regulator AlpA
MHILRTSDVTRLTGLSRTTLWRLERQGKFPTRIRLGLNSVGWRDDEVRRWVETRPRGMTLLDPASPSHIEVCEVTGQDNRERDQSERPL